MNKMIGGYRCLSAMQTAGSGTARWCMAARGNERYFLKEFLSPVYPADPTTAIGQRQLERCETFEKRKLRLYEAAGCVLGDVLVPVIDFFRDNYHYYAVSEAVGEGHLTAESADQLTAEEKKSVLYELALGLQRLHAQNIVHADLKPEHVLLIRQSDGWKCRVIDFDSGFLQDSPPRQGMEGDPAYMAPEAFLQMSGAQVSLTTALDVFAFGAIIHQIWTGRLPDFDRQQYHYLYEAAMNGGEVRLNLPEEWEHVVRRMLHADASCRPSDMEIVEMFADAGTAGKSARKVRNGLSGLMKV